MKITKNSSYNLMDGVSAIDNYDSNITNKIQVIDTGFDNAIIGFYNIEYIVLDSSNNETRVIRKIEVVDNDFQII